MRTSVAAILWFISWFISCFSGLVCMAQAAQIQQQHSTPTQDGGVREVLESIVIPPMPHAPFTATLATESTKYTADGASMTYVNERRIAGY
jgi:hypothetical protein